MHIHINVCRICNYQYKYSVRLLYGAVHHCSIKQILKKNDVGNHNSAFYLVF